MKVKRIDHLVLTVHDVDRAAHWYNRIFGMEIIVRDNGDRALEFGEGDFRQRIHLHGTGHERVPHALHPQPGSADLCLVAQIPIAKLLAELQADGVEPVLLGAVRRDGAMGPTESVYVRDPEGNLVEIADYPHDLPNEPFERYT